ncbi:MAG: hypothetical protein J5835_06385 [Bacteroidales bacterium]|nr:hypothetical protein [Bacteroidales bacterium]
MKKNYLYAALAVFGIFASCNKQQPETTVTPDTTGTEVLLKVNDALWTDDTKTAYTPGVGVGLTGVEMISLYYQTDETHFDGNIKASPSATPGEYTFTIPAAADGKTHWFGLMPYSSHVNGFNSQKTSVTLRLGPVQFPAANSFDPHCDYMVAKPFDVMGVAGEETGEIVSFKRLFAPLCVAVTGLEEGDKIYTATLSLSQEPVAKNLLAGIAFVHMNDDYAGNTTEIGTGAAGNAVSAEYATGLAAIDGSWPIWLMVNPMSIEAGGTMTLCVSTADKTYTRTVTLPSPQTLGMDQLNRITFNIKGDNYIVAESVTQDFTAQTLTGTQTLTASDGSSLSWVSSITRTFSSASDNDSGITGAMYAHQPFTFPTIPGKNIVGARIFCHPASRYGGGASASTLTVDGTEYNYNLANFNGNDGMCYKGGALDIPLPAGKTSLSGLTVTPTTQQNLISAITLFTEDADIDPDDYYAQYEAGKDITINGTTFNKATNGEARLVKLYASGAANELVKNYTANGILFLDYDESDNQEDVLALGYRLQPQNVVIIGRYRNHQPHIDLASAGTFGVQSKGSEIHLKNVKLSTGNWMFVTSNLTEDYLDVNIEDCTLNSTNSYVFFENHATSRFRNIVINNSIIKLVKSLYEAKSDIVAPGSTLSIEKLWVTNSVVYAENEISYPTIAMRISSTGVWYTPNLDLKLDHDTFYNLTNNNVGLVGLGSMSKVNVTFCVGDATLPKNAPIIMMHAAHDPAISEENGAVRHNYFNDRSGSFKWIYFYSQTGSWGVKASGNTFAQGVSPFVSTDITTGYFPVNSEVVTGDASGAGASYNTKRWGPWM